MYQGKGDYKCDEEAIDEDDDDFVDQIEAFSSTRDVCSDNKSTSDMENDEDILFDSHVNTMTDSRNFSIFPNDVPSSSSAADDNSRSNAVTISSTLQDSQVMKQESGDVAKQEYQFGEQARILLNMFIQHQARETPVEPIIHRLCEVDKASLLRCGLNDESLNMILRELNKIAAEISENKQIETFIMAVPNCATQDVFCEVAYKVFADGTVNWGRVVMVFYFGCRLVTRSLNQTTENAGWVKEMLSWLVDFIIKHFARWIIRRGGWGMIKEWAKFSDNVYKILFFGSLIFGLWAFFRKT